MILSQYAVSDIKLYSLIKSTWVSMLIGEELENVDFKSFV